MPTLPCWYIFARRLQQVHSLPCRYYHHSPWKHAVHSVFRWQLCCPRWHVAVQHVPYRFRRFCVDQLGSSVLRYALRRRVCAQLCHCCLPAMLCRDVCPRWYSRMHGLPDRHLCPRGRGHVQTLSVGSNRTQGRLCDLHGMCRRHLPTGTTRNVHKLPPRHSGADCRLHHVLGLPAWIVLEFWNWRMPPVQRWVFPKGQWEQKLSAMLPRL